jgi:hypothetical protein
MTPVHVASDAAVHAAMLALDRHQATMYRITEPGLRQDGSHETSCSCGWNGATADFRHHRAQTAVNAAWAVDAPDDTDLAARIETLIDQCTFNAYGEAWLYVPRLRAALVGEATGPTLHERIDALADKWEAQQRTPSAGGHYGKGAYDQQARCIRDLRAALAHDTGEPQ